MPYHINRIQELTDNIKEGNWYPYLYSHHFKDTAYLLGVFYPQLTLIPFALACLLVKNYVTGIYIGMSFFSFLTMINVYVVMKKLKRTQLESFLTSVVYCFCTYRSINAFSRFALGEYIGMTFIPLAMYGLYAILVGNRRDWVFLPVGLSFTLLSHVLSAFLCICILIIIFITCIKGLKDIKRLKALILSCFLFVCSSAIFIFPFLEQESFNNYNQPSPTYMPGFAPNLSTLLMNSLSNLLSVFQVSNWWEVSNVGFVLLIAFLWGIIKFKQLNLVNKFFVIYGGILFLISSSIFPWSIFMATPIRVIQFPFRLLEIVSILLSPIAGLMLTRVINYVKETQLKMIMFIGTILFIVLPWYSSIETFIHLGKNQNNNFYNGMIYSAKSHDMTNWWLDQYTPQMNKEDYNKIINHKATVDGKVVKLKNIRPISNGIVYFDNDIRNKHKITLPVAQYKNLKVYQKNKMKKYDIEKSSLITIKNTSNLPITVKYIPSFIDIISVYMSIITWLALLLYSTKRYFRSR